MIYDIESDLGGHCKCTAEVSYEDGEVLIHTIVMHDGQNRFVFTEADGRLFAALESLIDKKHVEEIILDKRENTF